MTPTHKCAFRLIVLLAVSACFGDPMGPGDMLIVALGASADTVVGAPGEPVAADIRVRVTDAAGTPLWGASVEWNAVGRNAKVLAPSITNMQGEARAGWVLGTDAAEAQQLKVTARRSGHETQIVLHARAVPHVVTQLRVALDTPAVLRLGDTLPVRVNAIDLYGNVFPAPDVAVSLGDSAIGAVVGASVIGARRGHSKVHVASNGLAADFPLSVTQYAVSIVPHADTIWFSSLGAERAIVYVVRDDRGRIIADTTAAIAIADTTRVQIIGSQLRSVAMGTTALHLALGPAAATITVGVQQRVASLTLQRDTVRFDALLDTAEIRAIARDSMNADIVHPALSYQVSNGQVATVVSGGTLTAVAPGSTHVTVRDSVTGVSASANVVVQQRVATIGLPAAGIQLDALGDTVRLSPVARDRLGSPVVGAALDYSVSDSTVVRLQAGAQLRSLRNGSAIVTARDSATGTVATTVVTVAQRTAALSLTAHSLTFTAVGDTVALGFVARDRLSVPVTAATVAYSAGDSSVATVTAGGVVRSHRNGSTFVVGRSADGPSDTAYVTVAQQVARITLAHDSLLFESLQAVQQAGAEPVDRLGVTVPNAALTYASEDPAIAAIDQTGHIRAVANGSTRLLVVTNGDTARVGVRIAQRPVRVKVPADTIRLQSLGDTVMLTGVAVDSLGSPVPGGVTRVTLVDTSVIAFQPSGGTVTVTGGPLPGGIMGVSAAFDASDADPVDSLTVRARGNGVTQASLTVAGVTGQVVIVVTQVATSLTVAVDSGKPIVTLLAGVTLPLACAALDKNGFPMSQQPALVRTVRGTVTGASCATVRVQHSGYDTLSFALGAAQLRVPVIVSTRPDSVGVLAAAQPLSTVTRTRFVGEDLANPLILALRPLVNDIFAAYGNPTSNLDRARALRDWLARTAVHPHPPLHPDESTANIGVLPPGKTWADVNALLFVPSKDSLLSANVAYWGSVGYDGYAMLNRLLGTLDPVTGLRADDGMMVRVTGVRYQIRDLQTYRYPICTYQTIMLNALWAAAGLHGMLISTLGHDPATVFIPELGRWVYEDATFNEEYLLDGAGDPLSPGDLLALSSAGQGSRLRATKLLRPSFDPQVYIATESYVSEHPAGMVIMGSQLNSRVAGIGGWSTLLVQINVPALAQYAPFNNPLSYVPVTAAVAFPTLGVVPAQLQVEDSVYVVALSSTFPNQQHFERRLSGGAWESVGAGDVVPVGQCRVEYRSVDALGNVSASALLDAWVPRAPGFVEAGVAGGVRSQARYCVSQSSP